MPTLDYWLIRSNSYLCEQYDRSHRLLPTEPAQRIKVREYIHAAEGTFMVHCLPTVYNRRIDATMAEKLAPGLEKNVVKDLDWLEAELKAGNGRYLVGDHVTAADTMVAFVQFIFATRLAPRNSRWAAIEGWLRNVEGEKAYQCAVAKTRDPFPSIVLCCGVVHGLAGLLCSCLESWVPVPFMKCRPR